MSASARESASLRVRTTWSPRAVPPAGAATCSTPVPARWSAPWSVTTTTATGPPVGHTASMVARAQEVLERAGAALRARGERMTAPRRAVLLALASRGGHVGAEEVVADVAGSGVHRSSVYRTLEAMTHAGVVQHVHLGHGGTAYHLTEREHPHAQCARCGAVVDLPVDLLEPLGPLVRESSGFVLDATHVALSGTCGDCARSGQG